MHWCRKKNKRAGFSLLEVMIALAILATSLMIILDFHSTAVITSGRAQTMSVATALARHQMAQLLLQMVAEVAAGRLPDEKSETGSFEEMGFPNFRWEMQIRKVEVPAPPLPEEAGGELVNKIIQSITEQISKATREMKLTVFWKEFEDEESIDVTTHLVSLKGGKVGVGG